MVKPENKFSTSKSECKKKYKGFRMRSWGSWVSEIRAPNQKTRIWLGSYSTPAAAARAYGATLLCLKGPSTSLKFPFSPSQNLNPDAILSPKSIQRIAAAAAATTNSNHKSFFGNTENLSPQSPPSIFSSCSSSNSLPSTPSPSFLENSKNLSVQSLSSISSGSSSLSSLPSPSLSSSTSSPLDQFDDHEVSLASSFDKQPSYTDRKWLTCNLTENSQ